MRRFTLPLVAVAGVSVGLLTGVSVVGAATPEDTACRKVASTANTASGVNSAEVLDYTACRFDKLDASVKALGATTPTPSASPSGLVSPTPSSTPTPTPNVTPSSTPTPTALPSPTASPSSGAKPGASNTGVPDGVKLTAYTGPSTITVDGTVISGKDVTGPLIVDAKNVVIKNSKIHGSPSGETAGVYTRNGSTTITDTEIYGFAVGLSYGNFTALRVDIHDITYDGIKLSSNASVRDSWIHAPQPNADAHWDGIQVQNGVVNTTISGNNIDGGAADTNSALFLTPDLGPSTDGPLTVTGNWLGGGNFTVAILDGNNGRYFIKTIIVRDNRFTTKGKYGYSNVNVPISQSGNVVDATGAPLAL